MDRQDIAYLINSTPKYYYILELHILLLRRYAPTLKWPIYFATEFPNDPICFLLKDTYNVNILNLEKEHSSFLQSRARAIELLPKTIHYVLPMQEDFLLDRLIDISEIEKSLSILDTNTNILSLRYMPCPGPHINDMLYNNKWKYLDSRYDQYMFTFQATLWRATDYLKLFKSLLKTINSDDPIQRKLYELTYNIAENNDGVKIFDKVFKGSYHLAYIRAHKEPNAVYLSPFPYRPTAIIKGVLQPFVKELMDREGFTQYLQNYLL